MLDSLLDSRARPEKVYVSAPSMQAGICWCSIQKRIQHRLPFILQQPLALRPLDLGWEPDQLRPTSSLFFQTERKKA